jgi:hypothetical protein
MWKFADAARSALYDVIPDKRVARGAGMTP